MTAETRDQLESSRARHAHESARNRRSMLKAHNRLRLLENAIRECAHGRCSHRKGPFPGNADECMLALLRRVPVAPRENLK